MLGAQKVMRNKANVWCRFASILAQDQTIAMKSHSSVQLNVGTLPYIRIYPTWHEECRVTASSEHYKLTQSPKQVVIEQIERESNQGLDLYIPQQSSLYLSGDTIHENVLITDKLEGSVEIELVSGDVECQKIRGESVSISTKGSITVQKGLEARKTTIQCAKAFHCKKLIASDVAVSIHQTEPEHPVHIGAVYVTEMSVALNASSNAVIDNVHGSLKVDGSVLGQLSIRGLNGTAHVSLDKGQIELYVEALEGSSVISTEKGCIDATFNPDLALEYMIQSKDGESNGRVGNELPSSVTSALTSGKINRQVAKEYAGSSYFPTTKTAQEIQFKAPQGQIRFEPLSWMDKLRKKHNVKRRS